MNNIYIVPCSKSKHPELRRTMFPARDAYTGPAFRIAREGLERTGSSWCVLSALYGFIYPHTEIGWYEKKMGRVSALTSLTASMLCDQMKCYGLMGELAAASRVIVLGSTRYAEAAAAMLRRDVESPVAGLPIGKMMRAIKELFNEVSA